MGLMTELFLANDSEAKTYGSASGTPFERTQLGGLTSLEFEMLWAILAEEEWNSDTHALIELASSDTWWVFEFPAAFVERLKRLVPSTVMTAATSWAATEEISGAALDVAAVIQDLARLARSAELNQRKLYLWFSL